MTFQPVLPLSGYAGWAFLNRTKAQQTEAFLRAPTIARDSQYFRENIGDVQTAQELVADRRLLEVSLTAFGLQDDLDSKAFVIRVLEDGAIDPDALANRLADKRYIAFTKAFGFGDFDVPRTALSTFSDEIMQSYEAQVFEQAVGDQDDSLRLALNLERGLKDVIENNSSARAQWFSVLGQAPLRAVFEGAFALPEAFGQLDIDQQLGVFQDRAEALFGTAELKDLDAPKMREKLIQRFLLLEQLQGDLSMTSGQIASTLLAQ